MAIDSLVQDIRYALGGVRRDPFFAVSRAASSILEFISAFGLRSYAIAGAIVLGASLIAAWLPSARAARMDPAAALRAE